MELVAFCAHPDTTPAATYNPSEPGKIPVVAERGEKAAAFPCAKCVGNKLAPSRREGHQFCTANAAWQERMGVMGLAKVIILYRLLCGNLS